MIFRVILFVLVSLPGSPAQAVEPSTPGSSEGAMCREHAVLEAVCTRCNPRLIAIFKAKKDWCEEHRFPESFCPQCRPGQKGRPAADLATDKVPADGLRVKLKSAEVASMAGLEVEKGKESAHEPSVAAWVRMDHDPSRKVALNPRSAGVIRSVEVQVGDRVEAGQSLAIIESASVGTDRSRLEAARTRDRVATASLGRLRDLFEKGAGTKRDALQAEQELAAAQAEMQAAEASLRMAGETGGGGKVPLVAPIGGVITRREGSAGQMVDSEHVLFEIIDPSMMWAMLHIPETEVTRVRVGQTVEITFPALEGRSFTGELSFLAFTVDPRTRTVAGRVVLPNPEGLLRANLHGEARIRLGGSRAAVTLPREAIQRVDDVWLAFVRVAPDEFETRRLKLGDMSHEFAQVLEGISSDEDVVTTGSFLLKTETLKGSIGAGCCEVEEKK